MPSSDSNSFAALVFQLAYNELYAPDAAPCHVPPRPSTRLFRLASWFLMSPSVEMILFDALLSSCQVTASDPLIVGSFPVLSVIADHPLLRRYEGCVRRRMGTSPSRLGWSRRPRNQDFAD